MRTAELITVTAATALAHGGVRNPAALAGEDAMKTIGDTMETLGNMVLESTANGVTGRDDLVPSVRKLGKACKACHSLYRE